MRPWSSNIFLMTSTGRWALSNAGLTLTVQIRASQAPPHLNLQTPWTQRSSKLHEFPLDHLDTMAWVLRMSWKTYLTICTGILELKDLTYGGLLGEGPHAVQRQFKAQVSENHLEIHLFWAGKGTCCVPIQGTYGPSISAISATPDFVPSVSTASYHKKEPDRSDCGKQQKALEDEEFLGIDTRPYTFSYSELRAATGDFCSSNKLGEGGFGPVYKGTLEDERVIAVKQLSVASHQGKSQFVAEIATIELNPKISDFGLAKLYDDKQTHINTRVAGTIGYLAPEYAMRGHLTEKADVFGFELRSEESNRDNVICTSNIPGLTHQSRVIAMLTGDAEVATVTSRPGYLTDWKFKDTTTFMTDHSSQMQESSVGTSTATTTNYSPLGAATPMLSDIIGEAQWIPIEQSREHRDGIQERWQSPVLEAHFEEALNVQEQNSGMVELCDFTGQNRFGFLFEAILLRMSSSLSHCLRSNRGVRVSAICRKWV
ncbi:hypothetical protein HAX54_001357 [Datura stramonium]|uniref:non-specific serine/threonine protein kinase n=1 Tax=Datura stramonium TaxID=4076 RepID=A0ABS8T3B8_DATST|nr:hypothetical protein [Datura stramonium]